MEGQLQELKIYTFEADHKIDSGGWSAPIPPPTPFADAKSIKDQLEAAARDAQQKTNYRPNTEEEINQIAHTWLTQQRGEKFVQKCEFVRTTMEMALRYTLKSFFENRRSRSQFHCRSIGASTNGPRCQKCLGGKIQCTYCGGKGRIFCHVCQMTVMRRRGKGGGWGPMFCDFCHLSNGLPCFCCSASGKEWCNECGGFGVCPSNTGSFPAQPTPPKPWDIPSKNNGIFQDEHFIVQVPNTEQVHQCQKCVATGSPLVGKIQCVWCQGKGVTRCTRCYVLNLNSVVLFDMYCEQCHRKDVVPCFNCAASGMSWCNECGGSGCLSSSVELKISFNSATSMCCGGATDLPSSLIKDAKGNRVFGEVQQKLNPIKDHNDEKLKRASEKVVKDHLKYQNHNQFLYQCHTVDHLPISQVLVRYQQQEFFIKIVGFDCIVFCNDLPERQASCC